MINIDERLADMPIMAQRADKLDARVFNVWRRARQRFGSPLRLQLPGLKEIEMVLADAYWVCVDVVRYDAPVLAWVDIEGQHRSSLHEPIACKLNYYHFCASAVRGKALTLMEDILNERLAA